jgi:hypothetical protein
MSISAASANAETTITISAPYSASVGGTFDVSFLINDVVNGLAYDFTFDFEPTSVICATKNTDGGFITGMALPDTIDCTNGKIQFAGFALTGQTGSGTLFTTTFQTLTDGIARISYNTGELYNSSQQSILYPTPEEVQIIIGNPPPDIYFASSPQLVSEDANTVSIQAIISKAYDKDVSIEFTASGTATSSSDYTLLTSAISIPEGQTSTTQNVVTITDDTAIEVSENIVFSISNATNATIAQPSDYTVNITDNDLPIINWMTDSQSIQENAGSATFTATLNTTHPFADVSFDYTVTGTASSGSDYVLTNGSLTIARGDLSISKSAIIRNDSTVEPIENIVITMGSPVNATCGTTKEHTITITDNDIPSITFDNSTLAASESDGNISMSVSMDKTSYTDVTLSYSISGTATIDVDFQSSENAVTISEGQTQTSLSITLIDDDVTCEPSETITITFNQVTNSIFGDITRSTITIAPNDPEIQWTSNDQEISEGGNSVLSIESCISLDNEINVPYSTSGDASGSDYNASSTTITIPANQQTASLTITVTDDSTQCEADETLTLTLGKPDNAYTGTNLDLSITIPKNDPTVEWSSSSSSGKEGDQKLIEAQLCMAMNQTINVNVSLDGSTATQTSDYTVGTLSIPANQTTASLAVNLKDDETRCENNETIILSISDSNDVSAGTNNTHTVTISQNDPEIQFSSSIQQELSEGNTATLNISSCVSIEDPITIPYEISGTSENTDYSVLTTSLSIPADQTSTSLSISIIDDTTKCETDETIIVTLGKPDNAYAGSQIENQITITKNDPTVQWTSSSQQGSEGDHLSIQAEICMSMAEETDIQCSVSGGSASTLDYSIGTLSIPANLTRASLNISINDDSTTCESEETIVVSINDSSDAFAGETINHTITIAENDPIIQWSSSEQSVLENVGIVTLTATTCVKNTVDYDIPYTVSGTSDSNDHTLENGTFTLKANTTSALLTFTVSDDEVVESTENISIQLGKVGDVLPSDPDTHKVLISDNDLPTLSWKTTSQSISEDSGTMVLTVTMDKVSYTTVTIDYVTSGDVESEDYSLTDGTLTISAGQDSATIQINIINDTEDEPDEVLHITLSNPQNASTGPEKLSLTIVDNDTPLVQFDSESFVVTENPGNEAIVNVTMPDISYQDIVIPYTLGGTAQSTDYTLNEGSVTIQSTYTKTTLTIPIIDDSLDEPQETLVITLGDPDNADIGSKNAYTITINDNDVPQIAWEKSEFIADENAKSLSLTVQLDIAGYTDISLDYTITEVSATQGEDYTLSNGSLLIPAGQLSISINILIADDDVVEPNESINISLENITNGVQGEIHQTAVIIRDDDMTQVEWTKASETFGEDQGTISLSVSLNKTSYTDVTVPYALTLSGTASTEDHTILSGTFVIPANTTILTKTFAISEDSIDEPNESIILELQTPTNAKLGINQIKEITITDNDVPLVSWSKSSQNVNENIGQINVTAQLSIISYTDVTIPYVVSGTTDSNDHQLNDGHLSIPKGVTSTILDINIIDDNIDEPAETLIVSFGTPVNAGVNTSNNTFTLTLEDNETPELNWKYLTQALSENAGTITLTATLTIPAYTDVIIEYSVSGSAEKTIDHQLMNGNLTIPAGLTSISVTSQIIDDDIVEPVEDIIVLITNVTHASKGTSDTHIAKITDNDLPVVNWQNSTLSLSESASVIPLTLTMDRVSYTSVSLSYTITGTATAGIDFQSPQDSVTISAGQTEASLYLTLIDDAITCEPSETIIITFDQVSNADFGNLTRTTITIAPNDPEIQWTSNDQEISEGGNLALHIESCISLDSAINVPYSTGGDASASDYNASSTTITIPANQQSASLTITAVDDAAQCETDETLTLTLGKPDNAYQGTNLDLSITIPKNDPTVEWSTTSSSAQEGDQLLIEAQLCMAMNQTINVDLSIENGTATETSDYTVGTLSIPANQTTASLLLNIKDDATTCENDETIPILINDSDDVSAGTNNTHTVTISQNDPEIQFTSSSQQELSEGNTATLNISSCVSINDPITIPYEISGTSESSDYAILNNILTIPANQTSTNLSISIVDDNTTCEPDESLIVTLGKPDNAYTGTQLTNQITITKNDPTVQWTSTSQQANEGDNLFIQAEMCLAMDQQIDVQCTVSGGSATTSDYTIGTLSIPANLTRANLNMTITNDTTTCESEETIIVSIQDSSNAYAGSTKDHTITIGENDPVIQWISSEQNILESVGTVTLTATTCVISTVDYDIPYTVAGDSDTNDHSLNNGTFTLKANTTSALLTFTVSDDDVVEPTEHIFVQLGKVGDIVPSDPDIHEILISDNDLPTLSWKTASQSIIEDSGTMVLTVTMDKVSYTTVTVNYITSGDVESEDHSLTDGTLTISAGLNSATIPINIINDTEDEPDEVLLITLSDPQNALSDTEKLSLTIVDNDTPLVQFDTESFVITENQGNEAIVNIIMPDISYQDIVIPFTLGGTAQSTDYTLSEGSVTIQSSYTKTTLTIPIVDDSLDEPQETLVITLGDPDNADIGSKKAYTLTINDNDVPQIAWKQSAFIADENANAISLTVQLDIPGYTDISFDYSITDVSATQGEDYTLTNGTCVIPAGQLSTSINLLIANDDDVEPNESINISIDNITNGVKGDTHLASVIIRDDDMTQVEWTKAAETYGEDQGTISFSVSLNKTSYTDVTVPYALTLSGTASTEDHTIQSGTFVIPANATILTKTFAISEDGIDEPNESIVLELQTPTNAKLGINQIKEITIIDNDVPLVSWSKSSQTANENIGQINVSAQLTIPSYTDVTIPYVVSGTTDSNDHQLNDGNLSIPKGVTSTILDINIIDDNIDEPSETILITLGTPVNAAVDTSSNIFTLTLADNETPELNWKYLTQTFNENAGTITLTATLTIPAYTDVVFEYTVAGSADKTIDHQLINGDVTIPAGSTSITITSQIIEDDLVEPHEDILLSFIQITHAIPGDITTCSIIIQDNDSPMITWKKTSQSVLETIGSLSITALLDKSSYTDVTVDYTISGTSSKTGEDHDLINNGTLTFPKDMTSTSLNVQIEESQTLCESKESLILTLSNSHHANIATANVYTLWIIDICPDFNMPNAYTAVEDAGTITVNTWAKDITSATYPQVPMQFTTRNDNNDLFNSQPDISSEGTLSFETAEHAFGTATVSVSVRSNAHVSLTKTFQIHLLSVNDAPTFTMATTYDVNEDSGNSTVDNWLTNISSGPENESDQTIQIQVSNDNSSLFTDEPDINNSGILSFTPAPNKNGTARITVKIQDSGNTLNGGIQSTSKQFTLTVNPINDAPVNVTHPTISGILQTGQQMTSNKGSWNDQLDINPGTLSYQYQWQQASDSDGNDLESISGAENKSLTLSKQQVGKWIRLLVTATDDGEGTPSSKSATEVSRFLGPVLDLPYISFAKNQSPAVHEQSETYTIPLRLDRKNSVDINLPLNVSGTATSDSDFNAMPDSIVIPAGSTSVDLTFTLLNDADEEPEENIIITFGTPSNAQWGSITQHTFTIKANDLEPEISSLSQNSSYVSGGTSLDIIGDKFVPGAQVAFGNTSAINAVVVSKNLITCIVPASNSPGDIDIKVTNPGGNFDTYTFTYQDTRSISGQILSASESTPVSNCMIEVKLQNKTWYQMSDASGKYSVDDLPVSDQYIVSAWPDFDSADCYKSQYYNDKDKDHADAVSTINGNATVNFSMAACDNGSIKGRVHDFDDSPLSDDLIWVEAYSESLGESKFQRVDVNGSYEIKGLKPTDDYKVCATRSETADTEFCYTLPLNQPIGTNPETCSSIGSKNARQVEVQNTSVANIDIIIDPACSGGTIEGVVNTCNGRPAANVYVFAKSAKLNILQGTFTDTFGRYTIKGLIPVTTAQQQEKGYIIGISLNGYPSRYYGGNDINSASRIATGSTDIDLSLGCYYFSGKIIDSSNRAVYGAIILTWSQSNNNNMSYATSNASGEYTISNLKPLKDYVVQVVPLNYASQYYNNQSDESLADLVDISLENKTNIDFQIGCGAKLCGRIYIGDNNTPAQQGTSVNISSKLSNTSIDILTDADGYYQVCDLDETVTDYVISVILQNYPPAFYNSQGTVYSPENAESISTSGNCDKDIVITKGFSIRGKIHDNSSSVSGIFVEAYATQGFGYGKDTSIRMPGQDINYEIKGLAPGTYEVSIDPPSKYMSEVKTIEITDQDVELDFELQSPSRMIKGSIYNMEAGKPVWISAWSPSVDGKVVTVTGTGNVEYSLTGLKPASNYRVKFMSPAYPNQYYNQQTQWMDADKIDITTYDAFDIDFTIAVNPTISGTVSFNNAQAGDSAWVIAFSLSKGTEMVEVSTNAPSYEMQVMEADDYVVSVWSNKYTAAPEKRFVDTTIGNVVNIDFSLNTGNSISGKVLDQDGQPVSGITVEASSLSTGSKFATTNAGGIYQIDGLESVDDYVLSVFINESAPSFFYSTDGNVRDQVWATQISTENGSVQDIDFSIITGERICGMVIDDQFKSIANVLIRVESESLKVRHSVITDSDGYFEFTGLPSGNDYKVFAKPASISPYQSQSKEQVTSNVCNLYFILTQAYTLSGVITDTNGDLCSKVEVELIHDDDDFYGYYRTDSSGFFEIKGIPQNSGYAFIVTAAGDTAYLPYKENNISITQNLENNITLTPALDIWGYLRDTNGDPVADSIVKAVSESNPASLRVTTSNTQGYYKIKNIPAGSDYVIKVEPLHYGKQTKTGQTAGTSVDFVLSNGGMISGFVKNSELSPISGIYVQLSSEFLDKPLLKVTNNQGYFAFKGLSENDPGGNLITDYAISTASIDYITEESTGHKLGDEINLTLTSAIENVIKGTLIDSSRSAPPANNYARVYLYKANGQLKSKVRIDANGAFEFSGLDLNINYQIKFKVLQGAMSGQRRWAGENGPEISKSNAKSYPVGSSIECQLDNLW